MVSSEDLRDLTLDTFYLLGDGDTIFTDDEIPMDEVLTNMHDVIKENQAEYNNFRRQKHRLADPQFIVLAKADFDRLHSFVETNFSRDPLSTSNENVTTNERCLFLNDIARRISNHYKNDASAINNNLDLVVAKVEHIPEEKTIAEVIDSVLEE